EQEKVTAEYKDGVLKVRMPKKERMPDKKVKVEVK
nr:Hsp20 family protein [Candidatus Paceibacterota bacterium]